MKSVQLTQSLRTQWNDFCEASDDVWFWHTTKWLDYNLSYKPKLKPKNLSFLVYEGDIPIAIVPLVLETHLENEKEIREFSMGGGSTLSPPLEGGAIFSPALSNKLSKEKRHKVREFIFTEIDKLAQKEHVMRAQFKISPLAPSFFKKTSHNFLMRFGYASLLSNTLLFDLTQSEKRLWDDMRRNHHRSIKKMSAYTVSFYTKKNITDDVFTAYKETHHKAAGRKTRPDETFAMMYDWLKEDLAFLAVVKDGKKQLGFEYFSVYKNNVHGFSAANDPDYGNLPIRHLLEWEAIRFMKKRGYHLYEMYLQQYGPQPYDFPNEKQLAITHFKMGFGGITVPLFLSEKYYDKKYFMKIANERMESYASTFNKKIKI